MSVRVGTVALLALAVAALALLGVASTGPRPVLAVGVGGATWTPADSTTTATESRFLVPGDAVTYETVARWSPEQVRGLGRYTADGLRYTYEINDRSGRLSATGFWATNHADPAFDRDDDDGDGRWEEAEITVGSAAPRPGREYHSIVQFTRWHPKRKGGRCTWAWDRRLGTTDVLAQLSVDLLGEWQAQRFTRSTEQLAYPRVGPPPGVPEDAPRATCRVRRPIDPSHVGIVVTFERPLSWATFRALPEGEGRWTAFEAVGSSDRAGGQWTCGGPVSNLGLRPCRTLGVDLDGVVAAIGYYEPSVVDQLRRHEAVARVDDLRDALTDLLSDIGGFGVQPPDLTINDSWWERSQRS